MRLLNYLNILAALIGIVAFLLGLFEIINKTKDIYWLAGYVIVFIVCLIFSVLIYRHTNPSSIPLMSDELDKIHSQALYYTSKIREGVGPISCNIYKKEIEGIINNLESDKRYAIQSSQEVAIIYRLYAGTILFGKSSPMILIKDAMPWLKKSIDSYSKFSDYKEFKSAVALLSEIQNGKYTQLDMNAYLLSIFRITLIDMSQDELKKRVQDAKNILTGILQPKGSRANSAKEDFLYLSDYNLGVAKIGQFMETIRITTQGKFPKIDVGGKPIFIDLPNGNTKVSYTFSNGTINVEYIWEVNKEKSLIIPLNEVTMELMKLDKTKIYKKPTQQDDTAAKESSIESWQRHIHPRGFSFMIPLGWTVKDDNKNKSSLLCLPGMEFNSQKPKIFCIVRAQNNINDPFTMREYYNKEFSSDRIINFSEKPFKSGNKKGAILTYETIMLQNGREIKSSFQSIIIIVNRYAIAVEIFGPSSIRKSYESIIYKITESLEWN